MVKTAYEIYPDKFQWRQSDYEYEFGKNPFDVICGTDKIRKQIESEVALKEIDDSWNEGLKGFKEARKPYLLY